MVAKTDASARQGRVADGRRNRQCAGLPPRRKLKKLGLDAADTSELFFEDVKLPPENLLGAEGQRFRCSSNDLPRGGSVSRSMPRR